MTARLVAGALLIAVPIAFNVAFFELGRSFDYPRILREPSDHILRRFAAGGTPLLFRWHGLLVAALGMVPLVVLVAIELGGPVELLIVSIVVGVLAALVQTLGLARWTYAVPDLARRYVAADGPSAEATRASIELTFATLHRYLGVGIGEHLGYLTTGAWTLLTSATLLVIGVEASWLGWPGIGIGMALLVGALEFAGPNERDGWELAGRIVPVAYVAWSLWLIALGVLTIAAGA